jgi:hypothetical protein
MSTSRRGCSRVAQYSLLPVANYADFEPERVKHLEMIQSVVSRLANEAALIRGWALTVSAAFFAFAAKEDNWEVAAVGMLPVVAFWGLNVYYLRAERQYRALHDRVREIGSDVEPFSMDARAESVDSWWATIWAPTLAAFYGVVFVVGAIVFVGTLCGSR